MTCNTQIRTSFKEPTGLALVVRGQFLVFAVLELAVVACETPPGGVVIPTNTPRL